MISKTGEAESITSHYLFALGSYRGLYILNWIYRYYVESHYDLIAIIAGIVQTVLYCDFFYLYITKGNFMNVSVIGDRRAIRDNRGICRTFLNYDRKATFHAQKSEIFTFLFHETLENESISRKSHFFIIHIFLFCAAVCIRLSTEKRSHYELDFFVIKTF